MIRTKPPKTVKEEMMTRIQVATSKGFRMLLYGSIGLGMEVIKRNSTGYGLVTKSASLFLSRSVAMMPPMAMSAAPLMTYP